MASCIMPTMYGGLKAYKETISFFLKIDEMGIYNQYGTDESSATYYEIMCELFADSNCYVPDTDEYDLLRFYPCSNNAFLYFAQL